MYCTFKEVMSHLPTRPIIYQILNNRSQKDHDSIEKQLLRLTNLFPNISVHHEGPFLRVYVSHNLIRPGYERFEKVTKILYDLKPEEFLENFQYTTYLPQWWNE